MGNSSTGELSVTMTDSTTVSLPIPSFNPDSHSPVSAEITPIPEPDQYQYAKTAFPFADSEIDLPSQISDCWNGYHPQRFGLSKEKSTRNTIHRISKPSKKKDWISVFGTILIQRGQYKTWKLQIQPRFDSPGSNAVCFGDVADVMIGICDATTVRNYTKDTKYNNYVGEFWKEPYFGYAFHGVNGKKCHQQKRGGKKQYGKKLKVGDVIAVELDMYSHELTFHVNEVCYGMAYRVDEHKEYVLAVALRSDSYDIQICS